MSGGSEPGPLAFSDGRVGIFLPVRRVLIYFKLVSAKLAILEFFRVNSLDQRSRVFVGAISGYRKILITILILCALLDDHYRPPSRLKAFQLSATIPVYLFPSPIV